MNKNEVLDTIKWLKENKDKITDRQPFERTLGEDTVSAIFLGEYMPHIEKPKRLTVKQRIAQRIEADKEKAEYKVQKSLSRSELLRREKEEKALFSAIKIQERKKYSAAVRELTKTVKLHLIQGFKPNLQLVSNVVECRSDIHFVIDHKISVFNAYNKGISIADAAHITNLRFITGEENNRKGMKNYIDDTNKWIAEKYNLPH